MTTATRPRPFGIGFWGFVILMLALTALFAGLGFWQVDRLAWKENLIAEVSGRVDQPPVALPDEAVWAATDFDALAFHPVTLVGTWIPAGTVRVFTSLSEPHGSASGPGYWIITPFAVPAGTVFVNRGFVPQADADRFAAGTGLPSGAQTLTGLLIAPEASGAFTPAPDTANRIDWIRNPARLATMAGISGPVLPAIIDLPAGKPGELPQGGETLLDFPNNHLGYAFTWFGFALLTPGLLAAWVWQRLRRPEGVSKIVHS